MNSGAKVKGKRMLLQSEFQSVVLWKKTFYAKSALHLLVPDFVLIEFCQFFRLMACYIPYKILKYIFLFTESICICTEGRRKYIFLISSILTETMHTNSNWLVQNNIQWQNCYKNSDAFVFIHCKVFVFVWQSFQFLSRSKVFACLRRL